MKITFDTSAFWESGLTYEEIYHTVAEAGFKYVSPYNQDFPGFWRRPKYTMKEVEWHKKAIEREGLQIASLTTGFRIQHPDEFMREYAIDCWKMMFEVGEAMGVKVFNTEIGNGRDDPELREAKLMRSLDVLVPILEEEGMRLDIQAHPDDFHEHNNDAYDIIRYYDSPSLGYLYTFPHTFHYDDGKGNVEHMIQYVRPHLKHIIVADTYNYTKLFRYNINPSNLYADGTVRCHAHIGEIGTGDVPVDRLFKALRKIGFGDQEDTIATFNPLGFPERAIQDGIHTREILERELIGKQDEYEEPAEGFGIYAR
ncbi:MAG: sugar phosphate isomerase/epimerase [Eubacterium sp.]|nr:sugar phosphate isomerase/epimerase [Eubacterium sp.]